MKSYSLLKTPSNLFSLSITNFVVWYFILL